MRTKKQKCPNCGGHLEYNEEKDINICESCGEKFPVEHNKDYYEDKQREREDNTERFKIVHASKEKRAFRRFIVIVVLIAIAGIAVGALTVRYQIKKSHEGKVPVPAASRTFIGTDYRIVCSEFEAAGFDNISYEGDYSLTYSMPELSEFLADLKNEIKNEATYSDTSENTEYGKVSQVSINGNLTFKKSAWFSPDSVVAITYKGYGELVRIGGSSNSYIGENYEDVVAVFEDAGFANITVTPSYDIGTISLKDKDTVKSISIGNYSDFKKGYIAENSAEIKIVYHENKSQEAIDEAEAAGKIQIPVSSKDCKGSDYQDVESKFSNAGFTNITVEALNDLSSKKLDDENEVKEIEINGKKSFSEGDYYDSDVEIIIRYHSPKGISTDDEIASNDGTIQVPKSSKKYCGMQYDKVADSLTEAGFTSIQFVTVADAKKTRFTSNENKVSEISIDGNTDFDKNDSFTADAEIIITYHILAENE